jgi:hypothetical protein
VPVVAIGGINASNIRSVIEAGADATAVISAVCAADDPRAAAMELASDALAVVTWAGTANNGPPNLNGRDYDNDVNSNGVEDGAEYDRVSAGALLSGPPNGAVTLADALVVVSQAGDAC